MKSSDQIFTKGNVQVQNIKVGDIHWEYAYGFSVKVKVIKAPIRKNNGWEWKSKILEENGMFVEPSIITYFVDEQFGSTYGPNLYDYRAYNT